MMAMNVAQAFIDTYGREEAARVCEVAGTNLDYFLQIAQGKRFPGRKLAERLQAASNGRLNKVALVFGEQPKNRHRTRRVVRGRPQ